MRTANLVFVCTILLGVIQYLVRPEGLYRNPLIFMGAAYYVWAFLDEEVFR